MQCPLKENFECPEHNKKQGCAWWLEAKEGEEATASLSGCAMVLTPMLLAQNINMGACVAKEMSHTSAEISAMRSERVKADAQMQTGLALFCNMVSNQLPLQKNETILEIKHEK